MPIVEIEACFRKTSGCTVSLFSVCVIQLDEAGLNVTKHLSSSFQDEMFNPVNVNL